MLRRCFKTNARVPWVRAASNTARGETTPPSKDAHLIHENGLYYGKFTKEEYEDARKYVTTQYDKLQTDIKGTQNTRERLGKVPQFPASGLPKPVTDLLTFFQEAIRTTGPLSLLAYMRQCLTHPEYGYYTTRNPLDRQGGDFVTSPEISSVFGEMVGIWLYTVWVAQGQPTAVNVVEFGPGRGTLVADAMAVLAKFAKKTGLLMNGQITLVEASPVLRREQWKTLCASESPFTTTEQGFNESVSKWGQRVLWVDTEKDIPCGDNVCNYVLAHEFFDALPIKSFSRTEHGWRELLVEHTPSVVNTQPKLPGETSSEAQPELETEFHLTMAKQSTPSSKIPLLSTRYRDLPVGSRIEICSDAEFYMKRISDLVLNNGKAGAALIIDYGLANEIPSNSLRGIYKHKFVSPFYKPGDVDLSIDVDFENLRLLAEPHVEAFGPVEQGDWLHELGAGHRFDHLIKQANLMANKELLYESYVRLTSKDAMGKIYKVLALLPKGASAPVGFGGTV